MRNFVVVKLGNETFEKLGAIGTLSNLLVYLTTVFNMKTITATTMITVFNGTTNFATLIGALLSDTYFGRYNTLGFASIACFMVLTCPFSLHTLCQFSVNGIISQFRSYI